ILDQQRYAYQIVGENVVVTRRDGEATETQQRQITVAGVVTDRRGEPIPGITVTIKGTTSGVISSIDGRYRLENVPLNAILIFSFVGMETQEVVVDSEVVNVVLQDAVIGLDEVVAIGYGSMRKSDVTSSVATV